MGKENKEISIIDAGLEMEGRISSRGSIIVKGKVSGTIEGNTVIVAQEGIVEANACVKNMTVDGRFIGEVIATEKLIILSRGSCTGTVKCKNLIVEPGGGLNASVSHFSSHETDTNLAPKALEDAPRK